MTHDRLVELLLEKRFGTPTPEEISELEALQAADPAAAAAEAAAVESLLKGAAVGLSIEAAPTFEDALERRVRAAAEAESAFRRRRFVLRALVAYGGIAAGAIAYVWASGGAQIDQADVADQLRRTASIERGLGDGSGK